MSSYQSPGYLLYTEDYNVHIYIYKSIYIYRYLHIRGIISHYKDPYDA